jgi:hypothetical protein
MISKTRLFPWLTLTLILLLTLIWVLPTSAEKSPFIGQWESVDLDGSHQTLTIGGGNGDTYHFKVYDDGASACGVVDGEILYAAKANGVLAADDAYTLSGEADLWCLKHPPEKFEPSPIYFQYVYLPELDVIRSGPYAWPEPTDESYVYWYRPGVLGHDQIGDPISVLGHWPDEYPAWVPFHITHGFLLEPWVGIPGRTDFRLYVNGVFRDEDFVSREARPGEASEFLVKVWVHNFPNGMTGTVEFTGHWFTSCRWAIDSGYDVTCRTPQELVEIFTETHTVMFTP